MKILKFDEIGKLNESPLSVVELGLELSDYDSIGFCYLDGEFIIGSPFETHANLLHKKKLLSRKYDLEKVGRIWFDRKVISFWEYPETREELEKVIMDINSNVDDLQIKFDKAIEKELQTKKLSKEYNSEYKYFKVNKINNDWLIDIVDEFDVVKSIQIPIGEFKHSKDQSKQLRIDHMTSAIEKERIRQLTGQPAVVGEWGSKNPKKNIEFRNALGKFRGENKTSNMITSFKLFETPDNLIYNGVKYTIQDGISFGIIESKYLKDSDNDLMTFEKGTHFEVWEKLTGKYNPNARQLFIYPGRLWLEPKLIAFWEYPTTDELKIVLDEIENVSDLNFDDSWRIEVIVNDKIYFVTLSEYEAIYNNLDDETPEKLRDHLKPIQGNVPDGVGSKKLGKDIEVRDLLGDWRGESKIARFDDFENNI